MKTLRPGMTAPEVLILRSLLSSQGYDGGAAGKTNAQKAFFDAPLAGQVFTFQAQHVDEFGKWLETDRVVGDLTWWALNNSSGQAQKKGSPLPRMVKAPEAGLSPARLAVVKIALGYFRAGIKESPNGANWGGGVEKFLTHAGNGPQPWCMHFLSHVFKEATGAYPYGYDHGGVYKFWTEAKKRGDAHPIGDGYVPRPGDFGAIIYPGPKKEGHIFVVTAVEKGTALGYRFNAAGGNEGNAVKFSIRLSWAANFVGFVNLYGDDAQPYTPQGLQHADEAITDLKGTR